MQHAGGVSSSSGSSSLGPHTGGASSLLGPHTGGASFSEPTNALQGAALGLGGALQGVSDDEMPAAPPEAEEDEVKEWDMG